MTTTRNLWTCGLLLALVGVQSAAGQSTTLRPETSAAFDAYVRTVETQMRQRADGTKSFLWLDEHPDERAEVMAGKFVIEKRTANGGKAPHGLIHDWFGAMFLPGASIEDIVQFFQDPSAQTGFYPELLTAKVLSRNGNEFRMYRRLLKKRILTVVLDGEFEVRYEYPSASRCFVSGRSTRIAEVKNHNTPDEEVLPVGEGHGFLWRMNAYWRLEQIDGGVLAELRTMSLSRGIPTGLGWIIKPFTKDIPVESITSTLEGTRKAVAKR